MIEHNLQTIPDGDDIQGRVVLWFLPRRFLGGNFLAVEALGKLIPLHVSELEEAPRTLQGDRVLLIRPELTNDTFVSLLIEFRSCLRSGVIYVCSSVRQRSRLFVASIYPLDFLSSVSSSCFCSSFPFCLPFAADDAVTLTAVQATSVMIIVRKLVVEFAHDRLVDTIVAWEPGIVYSSGAFMK
jgi:hypothetical protein